MSAEVRMKNNRRLPAGWVRFPAAICALLLTALLFGTVFGTLGLQLMTSRKLHERSAFARDVVDQQMIRIEEEVKRLAAEYGFDPMDILPLIDRESVETLDGDVVKWWTDFTATGRMAEEPDYAVQGADETLRADRGFMERIDSMQVIATVDLIISRVNKAVMKSAMLFRSLLVETVIRFAGERFNLTEIMKLLRLIPLIAGLGSLAAAGLIALLMSRRIQTAGQYIGGAMAAAGLLTMLTMIMIRLLGIRQMISEASTALERQYAYVSRTLTLEMLGEAVLLLLLGWLLMAMARKEY